MYHVLIHLHNIHLSMPKNFGHLTFLLVEDDKMNYEDFKP